MDLGTMNSLKSTRKKESPILHNSTFKLAYNIVFIYEFDNICRKQWILLREVSLPINHSFSTGLQMLLMGRFMPHRVSLVPVREDCKVWSM